MKILLNKKIMGAIVAVIALSFATVYLVTAKTNDYTPKQAIDRYYSAAKKGNIEEAKKYCATEVLDFYDKNANGLTGTITAAIHHEGEKFKKITPLKTNIKGKTAIVQVELLPQDGNEEYKTTKDYLLVKENDGWKLTFQ